MGTPGPRPSSFETSAVIRETARLTHLPEETVRLVLDTLIAVIRAALVREERVVLRFFGTFQAKRVLNGGFNGVRVRFKTAADLKKAVQEAMRPVEKYNVEMKNEAVLLAQLTGLCPKCKGSLESTHPPKCPTCGTEPFENKETK